MRAFASLREFFDQTGMRQEDIAFDLGISPAHLSNIMNGKRTPSFGLALRLSEITNVPIQSISSRVA